MRRSRTGRLTRVVCSVVLAAVMVPLWAAPAVAKPMGQPVYRFYNHANGSHFYTASEDERAMVSAKFSSIYAFEGVAYSTAPNDFVFDLEAQAVNGELLSAPLHRFYNKANGSHFYTISDAEKAYVQANHGAVYTYEGTAYNVFSGQSMYYLVRPVHRFYNLSNGSHFYTISEAEKSYVQMHYSGTYRYEGVAFYAMPFERFLTD